MHLFLGRHLGWIDTWVSTRMLGLDGQTMSADAHIMLLQRMCNGFCLAKVTGVQLPMIKTIWLTKAVAFPECGAAACGGSSCVAKASWESWSRCDCPTACGPVNAASGLLRVFTNMTCNAAQNLSLR